MLVSAADVALCWHAGLPDGTGLASGGLLTALIGNCSGGTYTLVATYQGSTANSVLVYSTTISQTYTLMPNCPPVSTESRGVSQIPPTSLLCMFPNGCNMTAAACAHYVSSSEIVQHQQMYVT